MAAEKLIVDYGHPPEPRCEQHTSDYYTFGHESDPVRPRFTLAAIFGVGISTVAGVFLLIILIVLVHVLSGKYVSEATCADIAWVCNGAVLVVGLILLPTVSRKSGGAYMGWYLLSAIVLPLAGFTSDFVIVVLLVSKWMC